MHLKEMESSYNLPMKMLQIKQCFLTVLHFSTSQRCLFLFLFRYLSVYLRMEEELVKGL